ncbi:hypothetical protein GALLR39Z86_14300 [Glycomyces algeriensis]|uniref:Uncharacterized protein n=1 Tax=Glycomyces algeriensis TaxID=256037 RepID=A0A9W6LFX0_9ACTN|nr:hypothetical protein GALLR39Z86_14300 [Glycomyces algeriensis]
MCRIRDGHCLHAHGAGGVAARSDNRGTAGRGRDAAGHVPHDHRNGAQAPAPPQRSREGTAGLGAAETWAL